MTWPDEAARVIVGELRDQLSHGRLKSGAVPPSASQLGTSYLISRQPARLALRQLAADGLVGRAPGRGTGAAAPGHEALRASPGGEQAR